MRNLKLALLLLTMVGCSTAAPAHALLEHATPAVGSTVASSPGSVTLHFTEKLEPKFSGGEVRGPGGARVDRGAGLSSNVMRLGVGGLRPGRYSVTWHALSVDTHKTQGSFSFQVGK
jgi:methionine-rich copper-binding protein CopC